MKIAGATVHLVTGELDGGPIVAQAAVPVQDDDTAESLAARILIEEHRIYPEAVGRVLDRGWAIEGRRFVRVNGRRTSDPAERSASREGSSVRTATSGGQLMRTGTYTVPTPRLTKIDVPSRCA